MSAPLLSLPTELVVRIIECVPPESHLEFALTCRRLADCAHDTLHRHRDAHRKYRVASDRDPATVVTLLRSTFGFGDPIQAWHVRSFESWDLRKLLRHDGYPNGPRDGPYRYADSFEWEWQDGEVNAYLRIFQEASFPDTLVESLLREIRDQQDGVLKMILFATLPRLRDLKFARSSSSDAIGRLAAHEPHACLDWLQTAIEKGLHLHPQASGLRGLESLAIGVETGEEVEFVDAGRQVSGRLTLQLLRLPRLSSLYVHLLYIDEDEENIGQHDTCDPAPGSSALEHLFLDSIIHIPTTGFTKVVAAAPRSLKTVAMRAYDGEVHDIGDHIQAFLQAQSESLKSMMVYNPGYFSGYRSSLFYPDEMDSDNVLQFSHDIADHLLCGGDWVSGTRDEFVEYFCECFGYNMQVFVLHGDEHYAEVVDCEDPIDEAVTALIESGIQSLRTVYLCGFEEGSSPRTRDRTASGTVRFQRAITAGIKHGVDVVTRTTRREDLVNGEPSFPRAMDRFDLATGRFGGKRPPEDEGRMFDPESGSRLAELCDHCGTCRQCLAVYPRELWEKAREDRAWAMGKTERGEWTESEDSDEDGEDGQADDEDGQGEANGGDGGKAQD